MLLARQVCASYLGAALTELVALSIANLEAPAISDATMSACNNACWSLGAAPACRSSSSSENA